MTNALAVIGVGRIGAVTAIGLAHLGHQVTGIDRDPERLAALASGALPEREPGLRDALATELASGRLTFASEVPAGSLDAAFVCVDTPALPSGEPDIRQVLAAAGDASRMVSVGGLVVTRSTVPVGTGERTANLLGELGRGDLQVVHAPEFLREGFAWQDFLEPDRMVFGAEFAAAREAAAALFTGIERPVYFTGLRTAELAKYAANAFLATTISFANEMSDLGRALGADPAMVLELLKADRRVGKRAYLTPGLGFGGHCLPKDTAALGHMAAAAGQPALLLAAAREVNSGRLTAVAEWLRSQLGGLEGRRVCIAGLAFKPGTDDTRESPGLHLAGLLAAEGALVTGYDREVTGDFEQVGTASSLAEAARGADALVMAHAGPEWLEVDPPSLTAVMRGRLVFDAPAVLDVEAWSSAGFRLNRSESVLG